MFSNLVQYKWIPPSDWAHDWNKIKLNPTVWMKSEGASLEGMGFKIVSDYHYMDPTFLFQGCCMYEVLNQGQRRRAARSQSDGGTHFYWTEILGYGIGRNGRSRSTIQIIMWAPRWSSGYPSPLTIFSNFEQSFYTTVSNTLLHPNKLVCQHWIVCTELTTFHLLQQLHPCTKVHSSCEASMSTFTKCLLSHHCKFVSHIAHLMKIMPQFWIRPSTW